METRSFLRGNGEDLEANCTAAKAVSSVLKIPLHLPRWEQECPDVAVMKVEGLKCSWVPLLTGTGGKCPCTRSLGPRLSSRAHITLWVPVRLHANVGLGPFPMSPVPWNWGRFMNDQPFLPISHMYKLALTKVVAPAFSSLLSSFSPPAPQPPSTAFLVGRQHDLIKAEWPRPDFGSSCAWCIATVSSPKTSASALLQIILHYVLEMFLTTLCSIVCCSLWSSRESYVMIWYIHQRLPKNYGPSNKKKIEKSLFHLLSSK